MINPRAEVSITFMSGPLDGKTLTWETPDAPEMHIKIGRKSDCQVNMESDTQVSRNHALVIYDLREDRFYLEDLDSRNGTYVGSRSNRLEKNVRTEIQPGQLFQIGRTWLRIDPLEPPDSDDIEGSDIPF